MGKPLISIIVPTFNSEKTIDACLDSVISQKYTAWELIVVDGVSSDQTAAHVRRYVDIHENIFWLSEKDRGIYDAMNKGIARAKGDWLMFLGSDDELYDAEVLSAVFSTAYPRETMMVYGRALVLPEQSITPIGQDFDAIAWANLCHQSAFYSHHVFKTRRYDLKYRVLADWDLNLYLFGHYPHGIVSLDVMVCKYLNAGVSADWKDQAEYRDNFSNKRQLYFRYLPIGQIIGRFTRAVARRIGITK